jgi:hypothetical protein
MDSKIDHAQNQLLLDLLQPVRSAFHDAHGAPPACLAGTRSQLLTDIAEWMHDSSTERVYWLTGVAGTGKTTVARSVASMAEEHDCLAATFFFSRTRNTAERQNGALVIPTIAYQLANKHDALREHVCRAVNANRDVRDLLVTTQAKELLSEAFATVKHKFPRPLLVVIDALDERYQEDVHDGDDLIPVLLHTLKGLPFCVKIFLTSRPESTFSNMFARADIRGITTKLVLHRDIEQGIVREDIRCYLRHEFDRLALDRSIPTPFPSPCDFETLLDRAGTLFIYARTVVVYVSSDVGDPVEQLAQLLRIDSSGTSQPFADLDALYMQILAKASYTLGPGVRAGQQLRDVTASLVLLQENVSVTTLAALSGVEVSQCKKILRCLSSLLLYDHNPGEVVRVMHPSFPDFLTDQSRCTDLERVVRAAAYHHKLAERCLQILNDQLCQDLCSIGDPALFNSEVPDLNERLAIAAPLHLRYAARFWHVHLIGYMSSSDQTQELPPSLTRFCYEHLLHWLELMSLLNDLLEVQRDLPPVLALLQVCCHFTYHYEDNKSFLSGFETSGRQPSFPAAH